MKTGGCKKCPPFCRSLSFDFSEICCYFRCNLHLFPFFLRMFPCPFSHCPHKLSQIPDSYASNPLDHLCLSPVFPWNNTPLTSRFPRLLNHRKNSSHFFNLSVQPHFAGYHDTLKSPFRKLPQRFQDCRSNRKIKTGSGLWYICRRKIDGNSSWRNRYLQIM